MERPGSERDATSPIGCSWKRVLSACDRVEVDWVGGAGECVGGL